jgi:hypothetical protein
MLSDFYDLKKDLNIVNKSYVTIGKPLKLNGVLVYVRDTMLLTPAVAQAHYPTGPAYPGLG